MLTLKQQQRLEVALQLFLETRMLQWLKTNHKYQVKMTMKQRIMVFSRNLQLKTVKNLSNLYR